MWDTLGLRVSGGGWDELCSARSSAQGNTRQQMEAPHVIPAGVGVGREGHGRRTKTRIYSSRPFPSSPSLPPCTGLFLHFLCFSCLLGHPDADTHTQRTSYPVRQFLCHRHREPFSGPGEHSGAIELGWESDRACPAPGGQGHPEPPGILLCAGGGGGIWGGGPKRSGFVGFAHASFTPVLMAGM